MEANKNDILQILQQRLENINQKNTVNNTPDVTNIGRVGILIWIILPWGLLIFIAVYESDILDFIKKNYPELAILIPIIISLLILVIIFVGRNICIHYLKEKREHDQIQAKMAYDQERFLIQSIVELKYLTKKEAENKEKVGTCNQLADQTLRKESKLSFVKTLLLHLCKQLEKYVYNER